MNNVSSKTLSSFKYVYLIAFFALLSGIFHPIINDLSFDIFFSGVLVYKTTTSETKREIFFGVGFILIGISLYLIFQLTGRV